MRYPGQYYDQETGLFYNYNRDYDPAVGRYVESDPIGLDGGLNTYTYVGNDPLSGIDPLGLAEMCYGTPKYFPHYWICANGVCGGLVPTRSLFGGPGTIRPQRPGLRPAGGDASFCSAVNQDKCDDAKYNQCVADRLQKQRGNLYYNVGTHNCMDWAWETLQACKKESCTK